MAKKQILSLVAASLVAATFIGCGSSNNDTPAQPLDVTVSDAYVYGATVTKGGVESTMGGEGPTYSWANTPTGDLISTGGANDLNGNGMADAEDPNAIAMKAAADYKNINPLTTLEANGMTLDTINGKYGIALETTDVDVTKADLGVYKAAAMAALELAAKGSNVTPGTPDNGGTDTDTENNSSTGDTIAPAVPAAIQFRADIAPTGPDGGGTTTDPDGNGTDNNGTDPEVDLTATNAAINAATDNAGVDAAVKAKMIELMKAYVPPVNDNTEDNTTVGDENNDSATDCLPGEDCTPSEDDNVSSEDDNVSSEDDNVSDEDDNTDQVAPATP